MMIKKVSALLIVLLISLPGCGRKKRDYRTMAKTDNFDTVNLALADKNLEINEETKQFFDEMDEFVRVVGDDFDLREDGIKQDEFAWQAAGDQQLDTVYFGFNKDKVTKEERGKVDHNINKAKKLLADAGSDAKLIVEGHACASAGSDAYNLALSERRAKEVSDQVVAAGVARNQVKSVGRGNEMLIVKDGSREEQAPNRRVEMHVIRS